MLQGIKLLKLYGWEELFCTAVEKVRNLELWTMFKINFLYAMTGKEFTQHWENVSETTRILDYTILFCRMSCYQLYISS